MGNFEKVIFPSSFTKKFLVLNYHTSPALSQSILLAAVLMVLVTILGLALIFAPGMSFSRSILGFPVMSWLDLVLEVSLLPPWPSGGPFPRPPPKKGGGVEHDTKRLCLICAFCT